MKWAHLSVRAQAAQREVLVCGRSVAERALREGLRGSVEFDGLLERYGVARLVLAEARESIRHARSASAREAHERRRHP